jgi:hypothetical protein
MKKKLLRLVLVASVMTGASGPALVETLDEAFEDAPESTASPVERRAASIATQAAAGPSLLVQVDPAGVALIGDLDIPRGDEVDSTARHLLEAALVSCERRGDMKVVVDLPVSADELIAECRRHRFNYSRTQERNGRRIHEFYADLYSRHEEPAPCRFDLASSSIPPSPSPLL